MTAFSSSLRCSVAGALLSLAAGCGNLTLTLPNGLSADIRIPGLKSNTVTVEVWNDTDYEVEPRIRYDENSDFWGQVFSAASELATGTLASGEFPDGFQIACDRVGVIYADEPGQFVPGEDVPIGQADRTRTLTRGEDFDCGDTIRFQFVGSGSSFGVRVSVNGVIVD